MSANATGTPTTNFSIPKHNTAADAPNGKGVNEMMDAIDALLAGSLKLSVGILTAGGATNGQVLAWNGSAWAPANTVALPLTNTGDLLYTSAGSTTARLGIGSTGQSLRVSGGIPAWKSAQATVLNNQTPTGVTGTGGAITAVQLGLGAAGLTLTPATSGIVVLTASGTCSTTGWTNCTVTIQGSFGTGAAPANAAAATGTAVGGVYLVTGNVVQSGYFAYNTVITGLTPGTTYWFDLREGMPTSQLNAQAATLTTMNISVVEVG